MGDGDAQIAGGLHSLTEELPAVINAPGFLPVTTVAECGE
jgi:hypothetical protein